MSPSNGRRAGWIAGILVASSGACFHARHVAEHGADERRSPDVESADGDGRRSGDVKTEQGSSQRVTPKRIPPRGDRPAVSASPEGLMNPGSARKIQEALHGRGYLHEVSGQLDTTTSDALRRFQIDRGLAATGAPDRETLRELGVEPGDVYQTGRGSSGDHDR